MRKTVLRLLIFALLVIILLVINLQVFRSEIPSFTIITLLGSVIGLLYFPYKTFFKTKQN